MWRPIGGGAAREMQHRRLAGLIVAATDSAVGDQRADRGDIDNPAALAALQHRRADQLGADEAARQIQIDHALPRRERLRLDRYADLAVADVVDQNVDWPEITQDQLTGR